MDRICFLWGATELVLKKISCFFSTATHMPLGNTSKCPQVIRPNGRGVALLGSKTPQCEKKKYVKALIPFLPGKDFPKGLFQYMRLSPLGLPITGRTIHFPLGFTRVLTMAQKLLHHLSYLCDFISLWLTLLAVLQT